MEVVSPHVIPHFKSVTHINATLLVQTINTMITTKIVSQAVSLLLLLKIPFIATSIVQMMSSLILTLKLVSNHVIQLPFIMITSVDLLAQIQNFIFH